MRATGQAKSLTGLCAKKNAGSSAARAILGEWIGGSGGGWQDFRRNLAGHEAHYRSPAREGDPEFGVSRGRLLPTHKILDHSDAPESVRKQSARKVSFLVHGGMAQNVGPILEMVTEKYCFAAKRNGTRGRKPSAYLKRSCGVEDR